MYFLNYDIIKILDNLEYNSTIVNEVTKYVV